MEGWTGELRQGGVERSGGRLLLPAPFGEKMKSFVEHPFRVGFDSVSGRAIERGGKGWRTADAVVSTHTILLGSERPTLDAYPCQILLAPCRQIVDTANAMDCLLYTSPSPRD